MPRWILGVALAVLAVLWIRREAIHSERSRLADEAIASARDSVNVALHDLNEMQTRLARASGKIDTLWKIRTVYINKGNVFGDRADSLIVVAKDERATCPNLAQAYDNRTSQCEMLSKALTADSAVLVATQDTVKRISTDLRNTNSALNDAKGLLKLGASMKYDCKILPFVSCPSRNVSAALGLIGGFFLAKKVF